MKINVLAYVAVTEVVSSTDHFIYEQLAEGNITWGGAEHTLVTKDVMLEELDTLRQYALRDVRKGTDPEDAAYAVAVVVAAMERVRALPENILIDMES